RPKNVFESVGTGSTVIDKEPFMQFLAMRVVFFVLAVVVCFAALARPACAASPNTYDAASSFEQGWASQSNPNGVWSYGYSSGFTNPVTLYTQTAQGPLNGPNAQYWLSPSVDINESPAAEFNHGPPYANGNV